MLITDRWLHRYWIEIDQPDFPIRRFGVTAVDLADALGLIAALEWLPKPLGPVVRVIEDVDIDSIRNDNDGLVNMAPPVWRGVWYPDAGRWASTRQQFDRP